VSPASAALLSGPLMILIGGTAVWFWRRVSGARARWFWIGVALWTVAIVIKLFFTLVDTFAGGVQISGLLGKVSSWWFELLFAVTAPASLVSIWWLLRRFGTDQDDSRAGPAQSDGPIDLLDSRATAEDLPCASLG
jgi:hypothetical protein